MPGQLGLIPSDDIQRRNISESHHGPTRSPLSNSRMWAAMGIAELCLAAAWSRRPTILTLNTMQLQKQYNDMQLITTCVEPQKR
eukprot:6185580-Pleurochrysis_carterae.AAC.2